MGFTVGGIGLIGPHWPTFWVGLGITLASGIVGKVMSAAGMGVKADH